MKVTKEFKVIIVGNIDPEDPGQFPFIGWKVGIDGVPIGDAWMYLKRDAGLEDEAETLAMVLKQASKDIKRHIKRKKC